MSTGRKVRRGQPDKPQIDGQTDSGRLFYKTLSGVNVPYGPVSIQDVLESQLNIEKAFRDRGEPIDEPEYTIKTVTGEEISFPITKDNLTAQNKDGSVNPEESADRERQWGEHQEALARMSLETRTVMEDIMLDGVLIKMPARDDPWMKKWIQKQERRYITVPEDNEKFYKFWLERFVFKTPFDFATCFALILEVSAKGSVVEGELQAAMGLFRSGIQSLPNEQENQVGSAQEDSGQSPAGEMAVQPDNAGSDGSEGVGQTSI